MRSHLFFILVVALISAPSAYSDRLSCREMTLLLIQKERVASSKILKEYYLTSPNVTASDNENFHSRLSKPGNSQRLVFQVENAVLKSLKETILEDAEVAIAAVNLYKKILFEEVEQSPILKKYLVGKYADYKTAKFLFEMQGDANRQRAELEQVKAELNRIYARVAHKYEDVIKGNPHFLAAYQHLSGIKGDPKRWHLAGFGTTRGKEALEANLASRARRIDHEGLRILEFSDPHSQEVLQDYVFTLARTLRLFKKDARWNPMLETLPNGTKVLSEKAIGFLRKVGAKTLDEYRMIVRHEFEREYGIRLTDPEISLLQKYFHALDLMSPSIHQASEVLDLGMTSAQVAVLALDERGRGAHNLWVQQAALADKTDLLNPEVPTEQKVVQVMNATDQALQGEVEYVAQVQAKIRAFMKSRDFAVQTYLDTQDSGDDMIFHLPLTLTRGHLLELMQMLKREMPGYSYRGTVVSSTYFGTKSQISKEKKGEVLDKLTGFQKDLEIRLEALSKRLDVPYAKKLKNLNLMYEAQLDRDQNVHLAVLLGDQFTLAERKAIQSELEKIFKEKSDEAERELKNRRLWLEASGGNTKSERDLKPLGFKLKSIHSF